VKEEKCLFCERKEEGEGSGEPQG